MDHLRQGIGLRGYGQKDPKQEYKKEGFSMFQLMMRSIRANVVGALMRAELRRAEEPAQQQPAQQARGNGEPAKAKPAPAPMEEFDLSKKRPQRMIESRGSVDGSAPQPIRQTPQREGPRLKPNDPCHCGSGKKYKKCHGLDEATA